MVEEQIHGTSDVANGSIGSNSGIEAKRNRIQFQRANPGETDEAFGRDTSTTERRPRRRSTIDPNKQTSVTISDNRPEVSQKVKGKPPKEPVEEAPSTSTRSRARGKGPLYPTLEDSTNQAKFLLSALEIACVSTRGPQGEMTEWERGIIQAPLQRCIARIPLSVVSKGGLVVDVGFLTIGTSLYFARVFRGAKLPSFGKKKPVNDVQEDTEAPVAARAEYVVQSTSAGDRDGLAQPIPSVISAYMNGAI